MTPTPSVERLKELAEYIAVSLHQPEKARHVELILRGWPIQDAEASRTRDLWALVEQWVKFAYAAGWSASTDGDAREIGRDESARIFYEQRIAPELASTLPPKSETP